MMTDRILMVAMSFAMAAGLAAPVAAQSAPDDAPLALEFGAGAGFRTVTSDSYDLFADAARPLWGGFSLGVRGSAGWTAAVEYQNLSTSSEPFGTFAGTTLRVQSVSVRGTYRLVEWPYVSPYVTAAAGVALGRVEIAAESLYEDRAAALDVHAAAGVEALSEGWIRVGGYSDLGYAWHSSLRFDELRAGRFGESFTLGSVRNGGLAWRIGVRVVVPLARRPSGVHPFTPSPAAAPNRQPVEEAVKPPPAADAPSAGQALDEPVAPADDAGAEPDVAAEDASTDDVAGERAGAENDDAGTEEEPAAEEPEVVLPEGIELQLEERPGPVVPRPGPPPVP